MPTRRNPLAASRTIRGPWTLLRVALACSLSFRSRCASTFAVRHHLHRPAVRRARRARVAVDGPLPSDRWSPPRGRSCAPCQRRLGRRDHPRAGPSNKRLLVGPGTPCSAVRSPPAGSPFVDRRPTPRAWRPPRHRGGGVPPHRGCGRSVVVRAAIGPAPREGNWPCARRPA